MQLGEVRREVDAHIDAVVAPLRRQLEETETLQKDLQRQAKSLDEPIARLRKLIKAAEGSGSRRPISYDGRKEGAGSRVSTETVEKVRGWLRAHAGEINRDGGRIISTMAEEASPELAFSTSAFRTGFLKLEEEGFVHVANVASIGRGVPRKFYKVTEEVES